MPNEPARPTSDALNEGDHVAVIDTDMTGVVIYTQDTTASVRLDDGRGLVIAVSDLARLD